ncbi:unnamed protein product [Effrenium voratum]|nr:unnamed protein product [Effrenium voratum]
MPSPEPLGEAVLEGSQLADSDNASPLDDDREVAAGLCTPKTRPPKGEPDTPELERMLANLGAGEVENQQAIASFLPASCDSGYPSVSPAQRTDSLHSTPGHCESPRLPPSSREKERFSGMPLCGVDHLDSTPNSAPRACSESDAQLTTPGHRASPELPPSSREKERFSSMPLCGVDHEQGIRLLRSCLARALGDDAYLGTERSSSTPSWGSSSDWEAMRAEVVKCLSEHSAAPPNQIVCVPAAFFRDADFQVPDADAEAVLVHGGVDNTMGPSCSGSHFMPLLTADQFSSVPVGRGHVRWRDMVSSVASRGTAAALDQVRDQGDCYFHSILVLLHFKGVRFARLGPAADVPVTEVDSTPNSAPRACSESDTQLTPTQAAAATCARRGVCFEDALQQQQQAGSMQEDPFDKMLVTMSEAVEGESLQQVVFPDRLFQGLGNKQQVYDSVKSWVVSAYQATGHHRTVAADVDFDLRTMTAEPFAVAVDTVAKKKGLSSEALLAVIEANIGFLEAPGTTLQHEDDSGHSISPASPVMVGSASSTRKSHLIRASDDWMLTSPEATEIFASAQVMNTDCTTKGVRLSLQEHGRCAISSDEAANTFLTKYSDKDCGLHFLAPAKLNTWTQCEHDGPATGQGKMTLSQYNFLLKVAGQVQVCEQILLPKVHGFQKRIRQVWVFTDHEIQDLQRSASSEAAIQRLHDFMHKNFTTPGRAQKIVLDGYALSMYRAAKQAIDDADSKLKQGDKCVEQPGEVVFAAPEDDLEPLEQDDVLKQQILSKAPSHEPFTAKDIRDWFKNKRHHWYRANLASKISSACSSLVNAGLLQTVEGGGEPAGTKSAMRGAGSRGRPAAVVRKRSLATVQADDVAETERKRLRVGLSSFQ